MASHARSSLLLAVWTLVLGAACSEAADPPPPDAGSGSAPAAASDPVDLPEVVEVPSPQRPLADMEIVEDMSEGVANSLVELAVTLKRRAMDEALDWFTDDFAGHGPGALDVAAVTELPLGATRSSHDVAGATIAGRRAWLGSLAELLSAYGVLDEVTFKVKGAEFDAGQVPRGRAKLRVTFHGLGPDRGPIAMTVWAWAAVVEERGRWKLQRLELMSVDVEQRPAPIFADVTTVAGVANQQGIFGKHGNTLFYWNGAASHDVDGDGLWDLFVPTLGGAFLYMNQGDGTFADEAADRGLADEVGGTGAVFFDADNDGDPDLLVSHVGWTMPDGSPGGDTPRLYLNDGGHFTDVSADAGIDGRHVGFSVVAADFDGNGFSDVYVCSYNRMDVVYPESWHSAGNGTPNALYLNRGDGSFEEVAAGRGADDVRWTFAAAAADWDRDGDLDLYLANDYGDNALLRNDGDAHFTDVAAELGVLDTGNGMATAWGDVDNDGMLDLYVANMSSTAGNRILQRLVPADDSGVGSTLVKLASGNSIFHVDADGSFHRLPSGNGGTGGAWAWSSVFLDVDLDADQDVFVTNGFVTGETAADT